MIASSQPKRFYRANSKQPELFHSNESVYVL